jgi:hypothetical protein
MERTHVPLEFRPVFKVDCIAQPVRRMYKEFAGVPGIAAGISLSARSADSVIGVFFAGSCRMMDQVSESDFDLYFGVICLTLRHDFALNAYS